MPTATATAAVMNSKEQTLVSTLTTHRRPPTRSRQVLAVLLGGALLALCCSLLAATSAQAAPRTPAWTLTASSQPTNLTPGTASSGFFDDLGNLVSNPQYAFVATNTGAEATDGEITFTDTLPAGITPIAAAVSFTKVFPCDISGQTVTCTFTPQAPIQPSDWFRVLVALDVAADAPPSVTNQATVSGGGAGAAVSTTSTTTVSSSTAPFDFLAGSAGLRTSITASDGSAVTQAGARPFQLTLDMGFSTKLDTSFFKSLNAVEPIRDVKVTLPPGVVVNPAATPVRCTEAQLESDFDHPPAGTGGCPDSAAVGHIDVLSSLSGPTPVAVPLYNMVPPPGAAAALAFDAIDLGIYVHLIGGVDAAGNYALTADSNDIVARPGNPILGIQAQLWGDPSDASHDSLRGNCHQNRTNQFYNLRCPVPRTSTPFLTMPSACSGPLTTTARAASWNAPDVFRTRSAPTVDSSGDPVGVTGCSRLDFDPSLSLRPDVSVADSPSGLHVDLRIPQTDSLSSLATANLRDAVVRLPEGVSLSPSAADGLSACSPSQIGMGSNGKPSCPDGSKIGTVEVDTPLLADPLKGSVYTAAQDDNPFGSVLGIYIVVEGPGVVIKLAGHVQTDPDTGQVTATFEDNPQLPFSDFKLDFFGGPRAALATPDSCGSFTTTTAFSPWSGNPAKAPSDSFQISSGCGGGFSPSFAAGVVDPSAGDSSTFTLRVARQDGQQHIRSLTTTLPPGLLAKVGSVPLCSDSDAEAGTCPASSQVGTTDSAAGPGSNPFHIAGKAFLTGPYKGGPYGLSVVTRAKAGPFDLGTVVVRASIRVDPNTAKVTAVSDDVPNVLTARGDDGQLNGFPLRVRSIAVNMDKPDFIVTPTSCDPMSITGTLGSWEGATRAVSSRFQVGDCASLGFTPKLALRLTGPKQTRTGKHPGIRAQVDQKGLGAAAIAKAVVKLPKALALDPDNAQALCEYTDGIKPDIEDHCPKGSIVGTAKATTPLLAKPLSGNVYFVKNIRIDKRTGNKIRTLPMIIVALRGDIAINLKGESSTTKDGRLVSTFPAVPDAPVTKFNLNIQGGSHGILTITRTIKSRINICNKRQTAAVALDGHNGKQRDFTARVRTPCAKQTKKAAKRRKAAAQRRRASRRG